MKWHFYGRFCSREEYQEHTDRLRELRAEYRAKREECGPLDPETVDVLVQIADEYIENMGESIAVRLLEKPCSLRKQLYAPDDPRQVDLIVSYASALGQWERRKDALPLMLEALQLAESIEGADSMLVAEVLDVVSFTYRKNGMYPEAVENLKRSLTIKRRHLPADSDYLIDSLACTAGHCTRAGFYEDAARFRLEAFQLQRRANGLANAETLRFLHLLACAYQACGQTKKAQLADDTCVRLRKQLNIKEDDD